MADGSTKPKKFTEEAVRALTSEGKPSRFIACGETPHLMLCVTAAGAKTFYARWTDEATGERKRIPLDKGRWPTMKVAQARAEVQVVMGKVRAGIDPRSERSAKRAAAVAAPAEVLTVAGLIDLWDQLHLATKRPDYRLGAVQVLKLRLDPHLTMPAGALARATIVGKAEELQRAGKLASARIFLSYGAALYGWAVKTGRVAENPFRGVPRPAASERDRFLSDDELGAVYAAAGHRAYPSGPFVRLLILTGLRRDEVGGMRWSEIKDGGARWEVPAARMKNKKPHVVHLSEAARAVLREVRESPLHRPECDLVFTTTGRTPISGFSNIKEGLDADSGVSDWVFHDLRRTIATGLVNLGVEHAVADKILAHNGSALDFVARIYQRSAFDEKRAEALRLWGAHVVRCAEAQAPAVAARMAENRAEAERKARAGGERSVAVRAARKAARCAPAAA